MPKSHECIEESLKNILLNNGYVTFLDNPDCKLMFDSIEFINLIVEIENEFEIYIPDEYLVPGAINSYNEILHMIKCLLDAE